MKTPKNAKKHYCEICDFISNKLSEYNRHILTKKHKMAEYNQIQPEKRQKTPEGYSCECGKVYSHRATLYNHKKKCTYIEPEIKIDEDNEPINKNIKQEIPDIVTAIMTQNKELMKEHKEFKELLVEQHQTLINQQKENQQLQSQLIEAVKDGKTINNINNINNTNNVNYNINLFLNDQCKDAMNLMDFIDTIKCKLEDLEDIGKLGYVDGISKLFIENLSGMEVTKRPIHCTDLKRKSLYIKNNDEWTKDSNNSEMRKAINTVANKNIKNIDEWRNKNPEHHHVNGSGIKKKQYLDILNESLVTDDDGKKGDKIIKNISAVVSIDKEMLKSCELENK